MTYTTYFLMEEFTLAEFASRNFH